MRSLFVFLIAILVFHTARAKQYDKAQVTQYLEEQSYASVLELGNDVPLIERDNYLLNAMGYAAFQMGLLSQSVSFYEASFLIDSNNIQANLYLATIKRQQKKIKEALGFYQRLIVIKPNQARYLKSMADCFLLLSQGDSAYHYLGKAYAAAPQDVSIKIALAELLYEMKNYIEVDKLVQEGLLLDSTNVTLFGLGVRSGYNQKQYKRILPIVDKMTKMGLGESIFTPTMFGVFAAIQLKDYSKSLSYTDYLMRNGSEAEQVYYYAAKACAGLKQYEKSNQYLTKCLDLAISENTETYYTEMGENFEALKSFSKAQKNYDTARFFSGNSILLYRKALAYEAVSDTEKAKKAYKDFLKQAQKEDTAFINFAKKRMTEL